MATRQTVRVPSRPRPPIGRLLAIPAFVAVLFALVYVIVTGGTSPYGVHARFTDASQLVKGDLVEIGGRPIGTVSHIGLSDDNQADVTLKITDEGFRPLRRGTDAVIRTVGLAGVANRFVEIEPGPPGAPALPDGAVLDSSHTQPVVDLDALLDSLDPRARADLQAIIRKGQVATAGVGRDSNRALHYLNPALSQSALLTADVVRDQVALEQLITSSASVTSALASRRGDLESALGHTATALRAVAGERAALADALSRAPGVLDHSRRTLRALRATLQTVRPAVRDLRPVAPRAAALLRQLVPTGRVVIPVLAQVRGELPYLLAALKGLPPVARVAVPAVKSLTSALVPLVPIVNGILPYAPDLVSSVNAFLGAASWAYDANGHFVRIAPLLGQEALTGIGALIPGLSAADLNSVRTGLVARCAGGAVEPAPDGSNPYVPNHRNCNPGDDHR